MSASEFFRPPPCRDQQEEFVLNDNNFTRLFVNTDVEAVLLSIYRLYL